MQEINRKKYGLRKKDLGINWKVSYLAVDTFNEQMWAYKCEPQPNDTGRLYTAS